LFDEADAANCSGIRGALRAGRYVLACTAPAAPTHGPMRAKRANSPQPVPSRRLLEGEALGRPLRRLGIAAATPPARQALDLWLSCGHAGAGGGEPYHSDAADGRADVEGRPDAVARMCSSS
jgi:hypothetical protein